MKTKIVRIVKPDMMKQLDSVEKLIAEQFILEGRWKLDDPMPCHTCINGEECDKTEGFCNDSGICGSYQGRD